MGRASRRRAEQRQPRVERPVGALLERSTASSPAAERLERPGPISVRDGHKAWGQEAARPSTSRRPPFRRAPSHALQGLERLEQLSGARAELDAAIAEQVRAVVALGTDWGSVGRALGVTRQAARQRYGPDRL